MNIDKKKHIGEMLQKDLKKHTIRIIILKTIPITDKNIKLINEIEKEYNNVKRGENFSTNIEGVESRSRNSGNNNISTEGEETWSEYIDRVLKNY